MLLEDRDEHGEARGIEPTGTALGGAEEAGGGERLDLGKEDARAGLERREDRARAARGGASRGGGRALGGERRFLHLGEAGAGHLEEAEFLGASEAVLHGAHHAVRMVAIAFEGEHDVHEVLQQLGAREVAFLGDVADDGDRGAGGLGERDEVEAAAA